MVQPQYPQYAQPPVIMTQVNSGGGCLKGMGMGAGLMIGCIGVMFVGLLIGGLTCAGVIGSAANASRQAREEREKSRARKETEDKEAAEKKRQEDEQAIRDNIEKLKGEK